MEICLSPSCLTYRDGFYLLLGYFMKRQIEKLFNFANHKLTNGAK